jgi:hypothetical protein
MATTPDAIVDRMAALVVAVAPTTHSTQRFVQHREEMDFREWALANPSACLRRFSIVFLGDTSQALVTSGELERVEESIECVIAYPADFRHGGRQLHGLRTTMSKDAVTVEKTIGVVASDTTLKSLATIFRVADISRESGTGADGRVVVLFTVIPLRVEYARSLAA